MRVGANWSYDGSTGDTHYIFTRLNPDSVVIMSHAAEADYNWLFDYSKITIRAKTGPGHLGTYPSDILDYKEWLSERSLREAIQYCVEWDELPRVILGNEPDIEMAVEPVDDQANRRQAINNYLDWYMAESDKIRRAFPGVQISPAPLSQGNPDRWLQWAMDMHEVFQDADFLSVHCYTPEGTDFDDPYWGGQWRWYRSAYPNKPVCITETNLNG